MMFLRKLNDYINYSLNFQIKYINFKSKYPINQKIFVRAIDYRYILLIFGDM